MERIIFLQLESLGLSKIALGRLSVLPWGWGYVVTSILISIFSNKSNSFFTFRQKQYTWLAKIRPLPSHHFLLLISKLYNTEILSTKIKLSTPICCKIKIARVHTRVHAHTQRHTHTYTHIHIHTLKHTYTHAHLYTHTHTHTHIYIYIYMHVCMHLSNSSMAQSAEGAVKYTNCISTEG